MPSSAPSIGQHVRFTCPHCGKVNKALLTSIGRGGSCCRCGGGVKVPAMHVPVMIDVSRHAPRAPAVLSRVLRDQVDPARHPQTQDQATISDDAEDEGIAQVEQPDSTDLIGAGYDGTEVGDVIFARAPVARQRLTSLQAAATLEELADRGNGKPVYVDGPTRRRAGTPWWAWLIHLSLSAATLAALGIMYSQHARATAGSASAGPDESAAPVAEPIPQVSYELLITREGDIQYVVTTSTHRDGTITENRAISRQRPGDFPVAAVVRDLRE